MPYCSCRWAYACLTTKKPAALMATLNLSHHKSCVTSCGLKQQMLNMSFELLETVVPFVLLRSTALATVFFRQFNCAAVV